ncbi:ArsR family transcriptional regulator [Caballeronia sordidicola]|uniref:ArsR family transcriptional regulator n=2 Tax=Caballeronia sordidicola TaxID=196367 RepID=A0A158FS38_CABSO|nr:metalloregulator ArsR/SmtB family transcription factor [Caballeronia sordidicola]SAL22431.1 ArsR family transcriptional regulator [Caballeronia sordidicola]
MANLPDPALAAVPMDIDAIHKALANPVRREILAWLNEPRAFFGEQELPLENGVCAGQIYARCDMSQSTVSAHLATLHKAGLVSSKRIGQWVFFKRNDALINAFLEQLHRTL